MISVEQFNRDVLVENHGSLSCARPVTLYGHRSQRGIYLPCGSRRCPSCGPLIWMKRTRAKLLSGLPREKGVDAVLATLTAPGWPAGSPELEVWNEGASECWNRLRLSLSRLYAGARLEYFRVGEYQKRGAKHFHVVIRGVRFVPHEVLERLAVRAGFGPICWVSPVRHRGGVAKYLSKYLLKEVDKWPAGARVFTESRAWRQDWVPQELYRRPKDPQEVWSYFRSPAELFGYLNPKSRVEIAGLS